jgi:hypothetical protein
MNRTARILVGAMACSIATIAPLSISSADTYSGDYYGGLDINQRVIDGQREPLNKYLLKRRGGAQRTDPGTTGTIKRTQPPRKPVQ